MRLLQMSILGGILIIVIVLIRALGLAKLPKKMFLILWGVTIGRLLIPFSIPSPFSIYSIIGNITRGMTQKNTLTMAEYITVSDGFINQMPQTMTEIKNGGIFISPIWMIWMISFLALLIFFVIAYFKSSNEMKLAIPISENLIIDKWLVENKLIRPIKILESDRISTPIAIGIINPWIILPKSMNTNDEKLMQYVLTHELYHIKHFDMMWKMIMIFTVCIHWFNPFVWAMFVLFNRDLELICDEKVLRYFGENAKTEYAYSLIGMAEQRSKFAPLYNGFSKNSAEERIVSIMKMKKTSSMGAVLVLVLIISITTVFATNSVNKIDDSKNSSIIMFTNEDKTSGKISIDGGKTWMDEMEYRKIYPVFEVDWWTYDGYKEWLEEEKQALGNMIGAKTGYYDKDGILHQEVWTQEMIDQTIAQYEKTLEDIKNGAKVSKFVDVEEDVVYEGLYLTESSVETEYQITSVIQETSDIPEDMKQAYAKFSKYGMKYNRKKDQLIYDGKVVRYFIDILSDSGKIMSKTDMDGVIDIYTVRDFSKIDRDGNGKIVELKLYTQKEFDARTAEWNR